MINRVGNNAISIGPILDRDEMITALQKQLSVAHERLADTEETGVPRQLALLQIEQISSRIENLQKNQK